MPKIRDILGHVTVEIAQRKRRCRRDAKRAIVKGEKCLVVQTGPTKDPYSYCRDNARPMLDQTWLKLAGIYAELRLEPPTHDARDGRT
jgi:hypothetical protein